MDNFIDSEVVDVSSTDKNPVDVPLTYLTSILVSLRLMVKPIVKNTLKIGFMVLKSPNGSTKRNLFGWLCSHRSERCHLQKCKNTIKPTLEACRRLSGIVETSDIASVHFTRHGDGA
jgi:hypothetical protein